MSNLRGTIVWLTLPLALASGFPRIGCLCANGQFRSFCEPRVAKCCLHPRTAAGSCGRCDPTVRTRSVASGFGSNRAAKACCLRGQESTQDPVASQPGCTPVIGIPSISVVVRSVVVPDQTHDQALSAADARSPNAVVVLPPFRGTRNPDLPIPDLVVALRVFLI